MMAVAMTDTSFTSPTAVMTESKENTRSKMAIWRSIMPSPTGTDVSACSVSPSRLLWISCVAFARRKRPPTIRIMSRPEIA